MVAALARLLPAVSQEIEGALVRARHPVAEAALCAACASVCAFVPSAGLPCEQSQPKSSGGGRAAGRQGMLAGGVWRADPPHS